MGGPEGKDHMKIPAKPIKNPRELAVSCLHDVESKSLLIPEAMALLPFSLGPEDRNLAHEIAYGTMRYLPGLNRLLASFCKPAKLPPKVRWLLLASLYQLRFLRVPTYAVLDEANKLAVSLRFPGLKGLVNGVLRNADRQSDERVADYTNESWLLDPWLTTMLEAQYGRKTLDSWLYCWLERGSVSYWTVDKAPLEGDIASPNCPNAFRRQKPIPFEAFSDRRLYVQNESSQAIAELASSLKPKTVLDLCAAPGGKACYLAAFAQPQCLVANDLPGERMARLRENRDRLGLDFEITSNDATTHDFGTFELVLLDAPCSGIGIIGRHPEIKLLKREPADPNLRQTQALLMAAAWRAVQPGGHLIYTVCSLDQAEVPSFPSDAIVVTDAVTEPYMESLPITRNDGRFHFSPTATFDGFCGTILQKP